MTDARKTDDLDQLFAAMRTNGAGDVPDDLMARVLADAVREMPSPRPAAAPGGGFLASLSDLLGDWRGMGGLAAASCAGLWLGVAPPAAFDGVSSALLGSSVEVSLGLSLSDLGLGEFE